jgi:hypothetical protein
MLQLRVGLMVTTKERLGIGLRGSKASGDADLDHIVIASDHRLGGLVLLWLGGEQFIGAEADAGTDA